MRRIDFCARFVLITLTLLIVSPKQASAVDLSHYSPFQAQLSCSFVGTIICSSNVEFPTNKSTILEYVSFWCFMPLGAKINILAIQTTVNGVIVGHYLPPKPTVIQNPNVADIASNGQNVRIYADPGTTLTFYVQLNPINFNGNENFACIVDLSGEQG